MGMNGPFFRHKSGGLYHHDSYKALGSEKSFKNIEKNFRVTDVTKNYTDRYVPLDESDNAGAPINIKNKRAFTFSLPICPRF